MMARNSVLQPYIATLVFLCVAAVIFMIQQSPTEHCVDRSKSIDSIDIHIMNVNSTSTSSVPAARTPAPTKAAATKAAATKAAATKAAATKAAAPTPAATKAATITVPPATVELVPKEPKIPLILLYHVLHGNPNWWFKTMSISDFNGCPHQCHVTNNKSRYSEADMVMFETPRFVKNHDKSTNTITLEYFRDWGVWPSERGNSEQVRTFFAREPQTTNLNGDGLAFAKYMFNYTQSFLRDSDVFYPYGHIEKLPKPIPLRLTDFGATKPKKVLWFISNCRERKRLDYYEELRKYIQVDMYGSCNKTNPDPCKREYHCSMKLKHQYKFYLSFENSVCQDYITEKFWNALNTELIPIAMGASKRTYQRVAPSHSFIHVDDFVSPQKLAEYLHVLDKNNTLYNEYHAWRQYYKVQWEWPNCKLCKLAAEKPKKVTDITRFWDRSRQCVWP